MGGWSGFLFVNLSPQERQKIFRFHCSCHTRNNEYFFLNLHSICGKRRGLMVSVLDSGSSCPGSGPGRGTLCCVLGHDTLLSQCLSSPRCINGYLRNAGGNPAMD